MKNKKSGNGYVLLKMRKDQQILMKKLLKKLEILFYNDKFYVPLVIDFRNRVKIRPPVKKNVFYNAIIKDIVLKNNRLNLVLTSPKMTRRHKSLTTRGFKHYTSPFELLVELKPKSNALDLDKMKSILPNIEEYFPKGLIFDNETWGRV